MSATTVQQGPPGRARGAMADWYVLTRRNVITYLRKPDLLVFSTIQPVMFVLLFVYVFGGAMELALPPTIPYVAFLMPGIIIQTSIFAATQTGVGLAEDLTKGLIDRFRSLPMARSAVLAGRTLADSFAIAFQILLMLVVAYFVGFRFQDGLRNAVLAVLGAISVGYAFTWLAAYTGLRLRSVEAVQAASFTIIFPFVFASTAFVPPSTFPDWLQTIARYNPVSIWVDTFRLLTLGDVYARYQASVGVPLPPVGSMVFRSTLWFLAFLVAFVPLSVRRYRRT